MNHEVSILDLLKDFKFSQSDWSFLDFRIDIDPLSFGSDATNRHTQYSNPIAFLSINGIEAFGYGFTLGKGNELVVQAAKSILSDLDGTLFLDLVHPTNYLYLIANPNQLRWLSPNSGCVYMAAGLILNTILDYAAKRAGLPLWKLLALSPPEDLVAFVNDKEYSHHHSVSDCFSSLSSDLDFVKERISLIEQIGLPVYRTTWFLDDVDILNNQIHRYHLEEGLSSFKLKINNSSKWVEQRLAAVRSGIPSDLSISVDSNQSLSFQDALELCPLLSENSVVWLEEPFAPDNVSLHHRLKNFINEQGLKLPIATGENCPNSHLAIEFIVSQSVDIFQIDACRVFSIVDLLPILTSASLSKIKVVPHAGGSGLDELVPHWQAFRLAKIDTHEPIHDSLMENVGFCSHLFKGSTSVMSGNLATPSSPGFGVGLSDGILLNKSSNLAQWIRL